LCFRKDFGPGRALPQTRDLRQIEIRERAFVVDWRAELGLHRLSFGVASEIRHAALRKSKADYGV
jgi:hypothetical protein